MPSRSIPDILEDLKAGVDASDTAAVKQAVDELQAEYDRIEVDEQVLFERTVTARDKTSLSRERRQTLDSLARSTASVSLPRSSVLTFGAYYVTEPSRIDDSRVIDAADTLAEEEATLADDAEQAEPILDEVELPPTLALVSVSEPDDPQPKGTSLGIDTTVRNVGDAPAESVTVSATSDLPVSPSSTDLGRLASDATESRTFDVSAETAGTFTVELVAEGSEAEPASRSVDVTVLDKAGYVDRIQEDIDGALESFDDFDLPPGRAKGVRAKLEAAARKVEDAEKFVERDRAKQANNMLEAAANVLGAALNQLAAGTGGNGNGKGKGKGNADSEPGLLVGTIESLIDQLAEARTAEL